MTRDEFITKMLLHGITFKKDTGFGYHRYTNKKLTIFYNIETKYMALTIHVTKDGFAKRIDWIKSFDELYKNIKAEELVNANRTGQSTI